MKVFISHSSKYKKTATALSNFMESISPSVEVFCSSQIGSIKAGEDFVKSVTEALNNCDAFIPLLSPNYYTSKFCMIELGFAYSVLVNSHTDGDRYVFPIALPPLKKGEALAGTPLAQIQVSYIHDDEEMRCYLESIFEKTPSALKSGLNKKIHEFVYSLKGLILEYYDINRSAQQLVCKSQNVKGEDGDYLQYSIMPDKSGYTVNFRAKPFGNSYDYPEFLSFVYQYVDKIDLYELSLLFENSFIQVYVNNYTNSINKIDIEIKHSDNNLILSRQTIRLKEGENKITIPLGEIRRQALKQVSEICFVIKPSAYIEDEGMLQIYGLGVVCTP